MGKNKWSIYARFAIDLENSDNKTYKVKIIENSSRVKLYDSAIYWVCFHDCIIPRVAGEDTDATLTIGQAKNLEVRFSQFVSGVHKATRHSGANLLHYMFWKSKSFRNKYLDKMFVFYYLLTPIDKLDLEERNNIIWYIKKFGEPPILNRSIPKRYSDW